MIENNMPPKRSAFIHVRVTPEELKSWKDKWGIRDLSRKIREAINQSARRVKG
jgi:hypothetical protein